MSQPNSESASVTECGDDYVGCELTSSDQVPFSSAQLSNNSSFSQLSSLTSLSEATGCICEDDLLPEQVRWMYRNLSRHKRWTAFIGYDSLRLECKYQESRATLSAAGGQAACHVDEVVIVKGGLYEVDVVQMKCYPIYWDMKGK